MPVVRVLSVPLYFTPFKCVYFRISDVVNYNYSCYSVSICGEHKFNITVTPYAVIKFPDLKYVVNPVIISVFCECDSEFSICFCDTVIESRTATRHNVTVIGIAVFIFQLLNSLNRLFAIALVIKFAFIFFTPFALGLRPVI